MMRYICELGFALDDVTLYLDTHPTDANAIDYYNNYKKMYREAKQDYTRQYGPLNDYEVNCNNGWSWINTPWPWERGV
ncbi:MAG: spore coat protein CotJB [Lachnospiraceae bacterium]|nr:spore coat protein CotJB [Lachnospiraceae bacterium]